MPYRQCFVKPEGDTTLWDSTLTSFIDWVQELLERYHDRILYPIDFAVDEGGREKIALDDLPVDHLLVDIGEGTISRYIKVINKAATIFVNGPAGVYEQPVSALGTERLWTPGGLIITGSSSLIGLPPHLGKSRQFVPYLGRAWLTVSGPIGPM